MASVRVHFVALSLVLLIPHFTWAQQSTGSVCVASRADDPFWKEPIPSSGEINSHGLRVKIDRRPAMAWPQKKSLKIDALEADERHLLVVLDSGGKAIESVWFRFSEYKSTDLCMSYDGYQGVQLHEDTRRTPWCKCK
jgi:hypothetical protein